jgi:hypothetical protein
MRCLLVRDQAGAALFYSLDFPPCSFRYNKTLCHCRPLPLLGLSSAAVGAFRSASAVVLPLLGL